MSVAASKLKLWRDRPDIMVRDLFGVEPDPKQTQILQAFPSSPRIAMKASKGTGKREDKNNLIPTPTGIRRFGDLKPGDKIFTVDGSVTTVINTYEQGICDLYKVTFDDSSFVHVGDEHLWQVRGQAERARKHKVQYQRKTQLDEIWSVLTTKEIIDRGVRVKNGKWKGRQFEIPIHGPVQYEYKNLSIDPYVLGIWLGDGCRNTGSYFSKSTGEIEKEIRSRGFQISDKTEGSLTVYGLKAKLRELGILDHYSYQKYIPESFKEASISQRQDLLIGLMDTDGTIDKYGSMEYSTTSKQLALDVIWLVRSLGGNASLSGIKKPFYKDVNGNKIAGKDCYRVRLRTAFCPFKLDKKIARWIKPASKDQLRYLKRYIDKIELDGRADCLCIEVAHPSHLYLTKDFIVTHNTCTEAWLAWNFLLTRPHPKIAATSISGDNLSDNLWTEMAHWMNKSKLLSESFTWTKTRIFANDHPETWWMSARSWSKTGDKNQQSNTLAGLHADYIMFVLDESGGIPDAVMASAEAALSSCKEGHLVQGGNPTHLEGPLYRACTTEKNLWTVFEMTGDPDDPNRSSRVSVEWAKSQIEKYGKDNPWVLVNVFGKFPPSSFNALIGPEELKEAVNRRYKDQDFEAHPRVYGIDVARYGDDSSIIFPRQGLQAFNPFQYRGINGTEGAEITARKWNEWEADAVFIDNTGGFGASWIDNLIRLGKSPIGIHFSQSATNNQYINKRAEMAFELIAWIKRGGAIPDIPELIQALVQTTYSFKGEQLMLEPKEDVKAKLGYSPDHMDALMLTFALPVEAAPKDIFSRSGSHQVEYNPFSRDKVLPSYNTGEYIYDPRR